MVPTRCQIDILDVSGRLTIQNSADKEPDCSLKIILRVDGDVVALVVAGEREVVFDHFATGSFVAACKNILKFRESLGPSSV